MTPDLAIFSRVSSSNSEKIGTFDRNSILLNNFLPLSKNIYYKKYP